MTIRVDPDVPNPTHDISLTDKRGRSVGLIAVDGKGDHDPVTIRRAPIEPNALKTASGNMSWGDMEYPWSPTAQESFIGGRGMAEFESDATKYADGKRANTILGKVIHGPQDQLTTGYLNMNSDLPGSVSWRALRGDRAYVAVIFTTTAEWDAKYIYLHIRRVGTPTGTLYVELCDDSGSDTPDTVLQTAEIDTDDITDVISEFYRFAITAETLADATKYHIKVYDTAGTADDHWEVGVEIDTGGTKESDDNTTWANALFKLYYLIHENPTTYRPLFFQYKRATYMLLNPESGAPLLYINGDRGVADANTGVLTTLVDASKTWVADEFIGAVALLINGTGSAETTPYRTITDNGTGSLTMAAWVITHDTTTEYVIVGSDVWKLVSGHGLTAPITDVLVVNDIVYFAQGDAVAIRSYLWDQNAGAAREQWYADTANKATFIKLLLDNTDGLVICYAINSPLKKVFGSVIKAFGANLDSTEKYEFKDEWGKITYIYSYGSPQYLWVWREGTVFQFKDDYMDEIPLAEYHTMMMDYNGYGALPHNVYLYFPFRYGGLERYYNATLDDLGPNRDEGMPDGRQGYIRRLIGYPGVVFGALDGESTNISSILAYNQDGWSEFYRAPASGMRIRDMQYQVVPGLEQLDRIIVYVGGLVIWLPMPKKAMDPTKDDNYLFYHEAVVETGWIYSNLVDLYKFYNSIKSWAEYLTEDEQYINIDIKIDSDDNWTILDGVLDSVPIDELFIGDDIFGEGGRRIKVRVRSWTTSNKVCPQLKTLVVDTTTRIPVRYSYGCRFRSIDGHINLDGENDEINSDALMGILDEWAENLTPLRLRCVYKQYDDKRVFIDTIPTSPYKRKKEGYIGEIIINQVKRQTRANIPVEEG